MKLRSKLLQDAGYNALQTAFLQATGLVTFFLTSRYLPKADYGSLNWALTLGTTLTALAGLGLDQALVHRLAQPGSDAQRLFGLHFFHTLAASTLLLAGGATWTCLAPGFSEAHPYFLIVFLSAIALYVGNSTRIALTGLGKFKGVAAIGVAGAAVKMLGIPALWFAGRLDIPSVAAVWLVSGVVEAGAALWAGQRAAGLRPRPRRDRALHREMLIAAAPLFIALVFDTALARIDSILMGVLTTKSATADYIFAYKIFELAKLPLLIASPLFLPHLTRIIHAGEAEETVRTRAGAISGLRLLMMASVIPTLLTLAVWTPLMSWLSEGKYGASNYASFLPLALCAPLHYITNFHYFKATALGRYRDILWITIVTSVVNFALNLLLIPRWAGPGAGVAFLVATVLQVALYLIFVRSSSLRLPAGIFLPPVVAGVVSFAATMSMDNAVWRALAAALLHIAFCAALLVFHRRTATSRR